MSNTIPVLYFDDGSQFPLARPGQYTVGSQACDIQLQGDDIQPRHLCFISSGMKVMMRPENDAPVTVNGLPVSGLIALNPEDMITIGSYTIIIRFMLKTAAPPAPVFPRSDKNPFTFDPSLFDFPPTSVPPAQSDTVSPPVHDQYDEKQRETDSTEQVDEANGDDTLIAEKDDNNRLQPIAAQLPQRSTVQDEVSFTAYYPREFVTGQRGSVIVYAHLADALSNIVRDVRKFVDELGGEIPRPRTAAKSISIQPGTPINVVIECDHPVFDPSTLTRRWDDEWVRFVFEFKAPAELVGEQIIFHVAVLVHGIEVARIANCVVEILPAPASTAAPIVVENALAYASMTYEETRLYQRIFVSYSRRDVEVVEAYHRAQEALGNEVFIDTYSIRSGQDWQAALAKAIQEADVFQLFWSAESAKSDNVRDEWDYAIKYRCRNDGCRSFIRPVFWVMPLPIAPPQELQHLNFRYVPLGDTTS